MNSLKNGVALFSFLILFRLLDLFIELGVYLNALYFAPAAVILILTFLIFFYIIRKMNRGDSANAKLP